MRTPRPDVLPRSDRMRILPLDVTNPESIAATVEESSNISVLVNNAGIGLLGAFVGHTDEHGAGDVRDEHPRRDGGELRDSERFGPWVYRVARSALAEHGRSRARHPLPLTEPTDEARCGSSDRHSGGRCREC